MIKFEIWQHATGTSVKRSSHASRIRAQRLARALNASQPLRFTVRRICCFQQQSSPPLRHPR